MQYQNVKWNGESKRVETLYAVKVVIRLKQTSATIQCFMQASW